MGPQQHIEYLAEAKEKHRQGMQIDGRSAVLIETTEVKSKKKKHEQGSAQNQLSEQQTSYSIYNPETKEMTQIIVEETETGGKGRAQQQQYVTQQSSQYNEQYQQLNYNEVRSSARSDALRARSASPGAAFYRPGSSAERRTSSGNENMIKRRRWNAITGQFEYVLVPESELVRIGSGYVTPEPGSKRQSRPNSRLEERMNVSITSMRQDDPNKTKRIWNAQTNQWEEYNESQTVRMVSSSPQQSKPPMPGRQRSAMVVNQQGGAIPVSSQFELVKSHQQSQQQVSRQDQQTIKNELIRMQQSSGQTQYQENGESIFMVTDSGAKSKRVWNPHIMKFEFQTVDGQVVPPPAQETVQMHHQQQQFSQQQQVSMVNTSQTAGRPPHGPPKIKPSAPITVQQKTMQNQQQQQQVQSQQAASQQQQSAAVKKRVWNSEKKKFEVVTIGGESEQSEEVSEVSSEVSEEASLDIVQQRKQRHQQKQQAKQQKAPEDDVVQQRKQRHQQKLQQQQQKTAGGMVKKRVWNKVAKKFEMMEIDPNAIATEESAPAEQETAPKVEEPK